MLDPATGFLLISDKDHDDYRSARLVWVPEPVVEQLRVYDNYRRALLPILGLDAERVPFFFDLKNRAGDLPTG
ncbi:MAG: hypothetical protein U5L11_16480 [Arhodomonas sp.]|nr:hypothetical protein [Arhodomonas sp.]